jgi:hypothetical protein
MRANRHALIRRRTIRRPSAVNHGEKRSFSLVVEFKQPKRQLATRSNTILNLPLAHELGGKRVGGFYLFRSRGFVGWEGSLFKSDDKGDIIELQCTTQNSALIVVCHRCQQRGHSGEICAVVSQPSRRGPGRPQGKFPLLARTIGVRRQPPLDLSPGLRDTLTKSAKTALRGTATSPPGTNDRIATGQPPECMTHLPRVLPSLSRSLLRTTRSRPLSTMSPTAQTIYIVSAIHCPATDGINPNCYSIMGAYASPTAARKAMLQKANELHGSPVTHSHGHPKACQPEWKEADWKVEFKGPDGDFGVCWIDERVLGVEEMPIHTTLKVSRFLRGEEDPGMNEVEVEKTLCSLLKF